ncbi:class I SAM-dependent methyltransferase [Cupriavidus plantarum]|uniref:class I SAM-dependent methyltransferase n=1 Tax=Cupriavidus plantarum TaxID=942865 RepID=UPI000F0DA4D6|nr:class I SAM-dependent methyltransferase [Cupriavidus plantarum]NYH98056.1 SAM-dependent methyltransferase [Cupriavidus plantarum]RLK35513.1 methyltransferase family protein [Cupriavidus plantarum]
MMAEKRSDLLGDVAGYYAAKLAEHGETAKGVDWNGEESQVLRFFQLSKIILETDETFSVNDLGCGYGALRKYLSGRYPSFTYTGIDVAPEMIHAAELQCGPDPAARFVVGSEPDTVADYGIASGIFNVRMGRDDPEWLEYIENALDIMDRTSRRGFAFNCLTSYSDAAKMRDTLYYADPGILFDRCKRRYSRNVALLHDYGLYEFTILVRK